MTQKVTCTESGTRTYTCKCGASYTEEIKATGHDWKAATCTEPKTCSKCKKTEGDALGHSCKTGKCSRCGRFVSSFDPAKITDPFQDYINDIFDAGEVLSFNYHTYGAIEDEEWLHITGTIEMVERERDYYQTRNVLIYAEFYDSKKCLVKQFVIFNEKMLLGNTKNIDYWIRLDELKDSVDVKIYIRHL